MALNNVTVESVKGISSFYDMGLVSSQATNGLFWLGILIALFVMVLFRQFREGMENAIITASFLTFITSLIFSSIGFLQIYITVIWGIVLAGSILFKLYNN